MPLAWEHSAEHVHGGADRLAVTKALTSVDPDHPELTAARVAGLPIEPWQQVVADVAATSGQRLVAVAGTHGKSTTTGWLVDMLSRDPDRDPSAFVGALLPAALTGSVPSTARWGSGDTFVVEADEYAGNFDPYQPSVILLLNAEWDHPDVFADREAVLSAFERWIRGSAEANRRPTLIANIGDRGVATIVERLNHWPGTIVTVGLDVRDADVWAQIDDMPAQPGLVVNGKFGPGIYGRSLPGRHNAENGLMVIAAMHVLNVHRRAGRSLGEYTGVGRRMEVKGDVGGVVVIDDYAHHPTAIEKTLEAVRDSYPGRRLWAVYEPLTYHRTAAMLNDFGKVLATADQVVIADIWAGRDPDTTLTSAAALAAAVKEAGGPATTSAPGSVEETADHLAANVHPGDVVLVMGGGRSYVIAERLVSSLSKPARP